MGPETLTMLSLSALAFASAIDTQLIKVVTQIDAKSCAWVGEAPFCSDSCADDYMSCGTSSCGDSKDCCLTGYKTYCCQGACPDLNVLEIMFEKGNGSPKAAVLKSKIKSSDDDGTSDRDEY